ncbi:cell wall-binding repeat-containing protein [Kineococcus gypseus]|uniref:cell wall-binding repeat-containing protein n=1 Tax=Kineococcus gypseus TaxID=1637102 RepID=UPI003D7E26D6
MRLAPRSLALAAALAVAVLGGGAVPAGATPAVDPGTARLDVDLKAAAVSRVAGPDRVATAVAAAGSFTGQAADAVVLTRSDTFADALAGAPLASDRGGPLLLTSRTSLQPEVADAIRDVLAPGGTVYLLGDTNALSAGVESSVRALGFTTQRVQGADRFGTAVAVAELLPQARTVSLVNGWNYPDGLAAGALMGVVDDETRRSVGVVLLSDGNRVGDTTARYLERRSFATKIAVGGPASVAVGPQTGSTDWGFLAGADRYATAALVARQFSSTGFFEDATTIVGIATGENWPDALAGSALLAYGGGPVLLTRPDQLPPVTAETLGALQADARAQRGEDGQPLEITDALVFGSASSVQDVVVEQVRTALG